MNSLSKALQSVGCNNINLVLGVDFTASNASAGKLSYPDNANLHSVRADRLNPYEQALSSIAHALKRLDDDPIPCYGFGDENMQHGCIFSLFPSERHAAGLNDALTQYRKIAPSVKMAGPTSFAAVISKACEIVQEKNSFHILLILADGTITRAATTPDEELSEHEQETRQALIRASHFPLSIICVGIGDGPWDAMALFDVPPAGSLFDNFHFVNYTELHQRNRHLPVAEREELFVAAALHDVPQQYKAITSLKLLDVSRSTPELPYVVAMDPPHVAAPAPQLPSTMVRIPSIMIPSTQGRQTGNASASQRQGHAYSSPVHRLQALDEDPNERQPSAFESGDLDGPQVAATRVPHPSTASTQSGQGQAGPRGPTLGPHVQQAAYGNHDQSSAPQQQADRAQYQRGVSYNRIGSRQGGDAGGGFGQASEALPNSFWLPVQTVDQSDGSGTLTHPSLPPVNAELAAVHDVPQVHARGYGSHQGPLSNPGAPRSAPFAPRSPPTQAERVDMPHTPDSLGNLQQQRDERAQQEVARDLGQHGQRGAETVFHSQFAAQHHQSQRRTGTMAAAAAAATAATNNSGSTGTSPAMQTPMSGLPDQHCRPSAAQSGPSQTGYHHRPTAGGAGPGPTHPHRRSFAEKPGPGLTDQHGRSSAGEAGSQHTDHERQSGGAAESGTGPIDHHGRPSAADCRQATQLMSPSDNTADARQQLVAPTGPGRGSSGNRRTWQRAQGFESIQTVMLVNQAGSAQRLRAPDSPTDKSADTLPSDKLPSHVQEECEGEPHMLRVRPHGGAAGSQQQQVAVAAVHRSGQGTHSGTFTHQQQAVSRKARSPFVDSDDDDEPGSGMVVAPAHNACRPAHAAVQPARPDSPGAAATPGSASPGSDARTPTIVCASPQPQKQLAPTPPRPGTPPTPFKTALPGPEGPYTTWPPVARAAHVVGPNAANSVASSTGNMYLPEPLASVVPTPFSGATPGPSLPYPAHAKAHASAHAPPSQYPRPPKPHAQHPASAQPHSSNVNVHASWGAGSPSTSENPPLSAPIPSVAPTPFSGASPGPSMLYPADKPAPGTQPQYPSPPTSHSQQPRAAPTAEPGGPNATSGNNFLPAPIVSVAPTPFSKAAPGPSLPYPGTQAAPAQHLQYPRPPKPHSHHPASAQPHSTNVKACASLGDGSASTTESQPLSAPIPSVAPTPFSGAAPGPSLPYPGTQAGPAQRLQYPRPPKPHAPYAAVGQFSTGSAARPTSGEENASVNGNAQLPAPVASVAPTPFSAASPGPSLPYPSKGAAAKAQNPDPHQSGYAAHADEVDAHTPLPDAYNPGAHKPGAQQHTRARVQQEQYPTPFSMQRPAQHKSEAATAGVPSAPSTMPTPFSAGMPEQGTVVAASQGRPAPTGGPAERVGAPAGNTRTSGTSNGVAAQSAGVREKTKAMFKSWVGR